MDTVHLVAIMAPGSAEARIGRVQAALFSSSGLLSAQALPPLVPVAFVQPPRSVTGFLSTLASRAGSPWRVRTARFFWCDGWLFLGTSTDGMWGRVREAAARAAQPAPGSLFPVAEGFFAGCGEARQEGSIAAATAVPDLWFSAARIVLLKIQSPREQGEWWREVRWEIVESHPLRGRRKT